LPRSRRANNENSPLRGASNEAGILKETMRIRILVFGVLKDLIPESAASLELPDGARVRDLLDRYSQSFAGRDALWQALAVAVNREYVPVSYALHDGDEVALLPPVSGGAGDSAPHVSLVHERIDAHTTVTSLEQPEDGALVIFDGMVRNNTRGRRTLYLIYEAYEEMALAQMRAMAVKAIADYPIRDVAIVHRLGRIEVGESSVLIAVASAHRAAAFDACRWLIDTLKKTVPIWKKEHFEDGAVWADGEKFPPEISA
jgi:MoaE-MoaD fusion protein